MSTPGYKTFNYQRAWLEAAWPAYEQRILPDPDVMALYQRVLDGYKEVRQDKTLGIPWNSADDRSAFLACDTQKLAFASQVLQAVGHWWPGDYGIGPLFRETRKVPGAEWGATWKFTHLADQALRVHWGIWEFADPPFSGWSFRILEGAVRLCFSGRDEWTWVELCPANIERKEYAERKRQEVMALGYSARRTSPKVWQWMERRREQQSAAAWPAHWVPFVQTDRYMEQEPWPKPAGLVITTPVSE